MPTEPAQIALPSLAPARSEARATSLPRMALGWTLLVGMPALTALVATQHVDARFALPGLVALAAVAAAVVRAVAVDVPGSRAASYALLYAGVAMAAPSLLHALVAAPAWAPRVYDDFSSHDRTLSTWLVNSAVLTGPAHFLFAALAARRGYTRFRDVDEDLDGVTARPRGSIHLAVLVLLPTALTLVLDWFFWGSFAVLPAGYVALTATGICLVAAAIEHRWAVALR